MSFFEALMLICFGSAWPFSIYKSLKSRRLDGKSPLFLCIILVGYVSGIIHKIFYSFDRVIYLYVLNALLVALDLGIYFWIKGKGSP
jgi:hypothetical protein